MKWKSGLFTEFRLMKQSTEGTERKNVKGEKRETGGEQSYDGDKAKQQGARNESDRNTQSGSTQETREVYFISSSSFMSLSPPGWLHGSQLHRSTLLSRLVLYAQQDLNPKSK